jgi:hypothetical protein
MEQCGNAVDENFDGVVEACPDTRGRRSPDECGCQAKRGAPVGVMGWVIGIAVMLIGGRRRVS